MITTNRKLLARVCEVILARSGLQDAWSESGPLHAERNLELRLSSSQRVIVEFVRTLWSGDGSLKVSNLILEIEDEPMVLLGTLLVAAAYGEVGLRDWLAINEVGSPERSPEGHCDVTRH